MHIVRVTAHGENLEKSGNSKVVMEKSRKLKSVASIILCYVYFKNLFLFHVDAI